jgi:hypothetical protein
MMVIVAGHEYELLNADATRIIGALFFVNKKLQGDKLVLVKDGTTTEEVLRVLIDRLEHLDSKVPCKENKTALAALKKALTALEARTADRQTRAVEGTDEQ